MAPVLFELSDSLMVQLFDQPLGTASTKGLWQLFSFSDDLRSSLIESQE